MATKSYFGKTTGSLTLSNLGKRGGQQGIEHTVSYAGAKSFLEMVGEMTEMKARAAAAANAVALEEARIIYEKSQELVPVGFTMQLKRSGTYGLAKEARPPATKTQSFKVTKAEFESPTTGKFMKKQYEKYVSAFKEQGYTFKEGGHGELIGTMETTAPAGDAVALVMYSATNKRGEDYAPIVHNRTNAKHKPPTGAFYLSRAAEEMANECALAASEVYDSFFKIGSFPGRKTTERTSQEEGFEDISKRKKAQMERRAREGYPGAQAELFRLRLREAFSERSQVPIVSSSGEATTAGKKGRKGRVTRKKIEDRDK